MALVVQKFGGTSMATPEIIKKTARLVEKERALGHQVVVVVSAMAGMTDQLADYVKEISVAPDPREYDAVVSTGEQITAGLMALALRGKGIPSRSWQGWQLPVVTNCDHTYGKIETLQADRLMPSLSKGEVPVIAGFQGVNADQSVVTLGRGGSDLSAVALAAALKADTCDLYKDVPGVMTGDPKIVSKAKLIDRISYEEMLELASLGSKIIQARSIAMAATYGVPLRVRTTFEEGKGTAILSYEKTMEDQAIRGIACNRQESLLILKGVMDAPDLFSAFARAHILIDMVTLDPQGGKITLTASRHDAERALSIAQTFQKTPGIEGKLENNLAKLSLVGLGLRGQPDILVKALKILSEKNIDVRLLSTSEMKISMLIDEAYAELSVRLLHTSFGLDRDCSHEFKSNIFKPSIATGM